MTIGTVMLILGISSALRWSSSLFLSDSPSIENSTGCAASLLCDSIVLTRIASRQGVCGAAAVRTAGTCAHACSRMHQPEIQAIRVSLIRVSFVSVTRGGLHTHGLLSHRVGSASIRLSTQKLRQGCARQECSIYLAGLAIYCLSLQPLNSSRPT